MNILAAMIIVTFVVVVALAPIVSTNSALAKSNTANNLKDSTKSQFGVNQNLKILKKDDSHLMPDPFKATGFEFKSGLSESSKVNSPISSQKPVNSLQTQQTINPLLDKEEFDITVTNIKHSDIRVALTIDGLKNSTIIPGNPPDVVNPTSKVVVFKFDRHENAGTPGVLPIKLGDQYTACISFTSNKHKSTCLTASIDSITQAQKKTLDANYIPF
jgi:hypothetical protein